MSVTDLIQDGTFQLIKEGQKPDSKRRVSIGDALKDVGTGISYRIYRNRLGQIVLDPVKTVPAYEAWVFENKPVAASIKRGLKESAAGKTRNMGSFAKYAKE
jgi:hypothetical protein